MEIVIETVTALLTAAGLAYLLLALWGAKDFVRSVQRDRLAPPFTPGISILKPLKGVDPRMYAGLESHCRQLYPAPFELIFGVQSLSDPAVAQVERLQEQFPAVAIHLIECPQRLGTSGKVSNLAPRIGPASVPHQCPRTVA